MYSGRSAAYDVAIKSNIQRRKIRIIIDATAQREREKITSWKRAQIIDAFAPVLAALVEKVLKVYAIMHNQTPHDVPVEILFDECGRISFILF